MDIWIPIVISTISLIISAFLLAERLYHNRMNINVVAKHYYCEDEHLLVFMAFENCSRLPVSITRIQLLDGYDSRRDCEYMSKQITEHTTQTGKTVTYRRSVDNLGLPLDLPPLSAKSGYIYFKFPHGKDHWNPIVHKKPLNILISTNRGTVNPTLQIPDEVEIGDI